MALLPSGLALVGFAVILAGTAAVIFVRAIPRAYGLAVVSLAIFALEFLDPKVLVELGLQSRAFWAGESWWAPLTYMFVHADLFHIVGNLFILLTAGAALEETLGERTFLLVYFAAGFAGAAAHLGMVEILPRIVPPFAIAIGASGAIFGVLTTYAVVFPRKQLPLFLGIIFWAPSFLVLLFHLAINLVFMISNTGIAWWGHFAGYLVGLPVAVALKARKTRSAPPVLDVDALASLATTPETKEIVERIRTFTGATADDDVFREAWIDKLVRKARCPAGHALLRERASVKCAGGEYGVDLAVKR